ncbi:MULTISPECIES: phosphonate C-P lyase system protein PhnH [Mesorhizobium]|uniref:Phosphonate C-P lyase system protein PhnH n=2 Tax=Mesorhizobium TaxID=68287 RepID=A0A1A5JQG9_RHILI|nr:MULTISPECIES: phosphonate C-P lyase system protein PhnH [Mesorhizobium]MBE1706886.1 phosphonate C-P lyase system protein PhnH [Mesorhizobium japonicum]MBE1716215.1 phosphonate C-P lyase system protein PhnH [Mesorhizobium japonicum]MUT20894.1 phosphonate C-P lyase system protein PhnH [Mesorhizobium japonicum]MUT31162.1 phosphonate C-P lyase system protein PhnH [Mesorhizobium japonicum]OBP80795.1 phosphonate C-P lyase system protein PhnH [Mesorhizobium loti]
MDIAAQSIEGGFADPVFDAQTVFRAVMDAMARPGSVQPLPALACPPAPLSATAGAVALALCDNDTPLWLDPALHTSAVIGSWLGFHTGAPLANTPADAHFAFVATPAEMMALDGFAQGTQDYPDRSTTLILQVSDLVSGTPLLLEGPGIETSATIAPAQMPRHFIEQWKQNIQRFPRGVDIILATAEGIACLPRTTRIKTMEA